MQIVAHYQNHARPVCQIYGKGSSNHQMNMAFRGKKPPSKLAAMTTTYHLSQLNVLLNNS